MITAGTLAGEGRLNIGVVVVTSLAGWMLGSLAGYAVGLRGGRALLDHPGRLQDRRRKLLAKGDAAFGRHTFTASVTLPAYVSGIFRVRLVVFVLGALVSGSFFIALYEGLSYVFGEEVAKRIGDAGAKAVLGVLVAVALGLGSGPGGPGGAPGEEVRVTKVPPKIVRRLRETLRYLAITDRPVH